MIRFLTMISCLCLVPACDDVPSRDAGADVDHTDADHLERDADDPTRDADVPEHDGAPDAEADGEGLNGDGDFDEVDADVGPISEIVTVDTGDVRGQDLGDLIAFRGIPYAAPPVGDLRFRPPQPHPSWDDERDATTFGPECPQREGLGFTGSEDCLTLNILAPVASGLRPVMVFIHGGAFQTGTGSLGLYEANGLAGTGDVVVVTLNYRLGALGFLATPALRAESGDGSVGNYGIRDQIAALEWVERNIAAFGGDPDTVTVFGESAGGMSICVLLGTPAADGLFDRAIIQSGGGCNGYEAPDVEYFDRPSMFARGAELSAVLGCDTAADELACLRAIGDPQDIVAALATPIIMRQTLPASIQFAPNLDGVLLADDPFERIVRGDGPDVPLIIGSNADEAYIFTLDDVILTPSAYQAAVSELVGEAASEVLAVYPASDYDRPKLAYNTLVSDVSFICPALAVSAAAADGSAPSFTYHFTQTLTGALSVGGAFHGLDLVYVFGNFSGTYAPTPDDLDLVHDVQLAWTSFARGGHPESSPAWPADDVAAPSIMIFDSPLTVKDDIRDGRCADLSALGLVPSP